MKRNNKKVKPWKGSRTENMAINLPVHFIMLCHLLDISAERVLHDFMNTVSMESYGLGKEQQRMLVSYFTSCRYGHQHYSQNDVEQMLYELNCISTLWPGEDSMRVLDKHVAWRDMYHKQWFKKWYRKTRRKSENTTI